jgi:myo-inositol 2-dehydrogenase / D-chiro-inositol 1-dehydrogenase
MARQEIRTILFGGGRIGELHARNISGRIGGMRLEAIVEPNPSPTLTELTAGADIPILREPFDSPDTATGLTGLMKEADAAVIALPTSLHEPAVAAAAAAGLHIFCEKPLAADIPAATRIAETARNAEVLLQVGFNRRFDHNFQALRREVAGGTLGRIETVRVTSRDPAPPGIEYIRGSGGLFMDMTIHDFDMARFLTGCAVESVFVKGACLVDEEIGKAGDIDTAIITLEFADGSVGVIENSRRASFGYDQRAEIHGSEGTAAIENDSTGTLTVSDSGGVHREKPLYFFLERYAQSFVTELESFVEAVRTGGPPEVTAEDGLAAMRIAAACRLSLKTGREIRLEEIGD